MSFDPKTKILSAAYSPPLYHQNVSIGQLAMHYLLRDSSKVVQVCFDDGVELTAGEMAKLGSRIAHNLFKAGLDLGDVIGMVAKNSTYVTPIVLGCFLNGCPVSTVDPTFEINEIANMFKQTKPKLVFCDHENWRTVVEALRLCGNASKAVTVDEKLLGVTKCSWIFLSQINESFISRRSICGRNVSTTRGRRIRVGFTNCLLEIKFSRDLQIFFFSDSETSQSIQRNSVQ